jgi:hypothetical protein
MAFFLKCSFWSLVHQGNLVRRAGGNTFNEKVGLLDDWRFLTMTGSFFLGARKKTQRHAGALAWFYFEIAAACQKCCGWSLT